LNRLLVNGFLQPGVWPLSSLHTSSSNFSFSGESGFALTNGGLERPSCVAISAHITPQLYRLTISSPVEDSHPRRSFRNELSRILVPYSIPEESLSHRHLYFVGTSRNGSEAIREVHLRYLCSTQTEPRRNKPLQITSRLPRLLY
jgi:hypothetical protein